MSQRASTLAALLSLFQLFAPLPRSLALITGLTGQLVNLDEAAAAALSLKLYQSMAGCRANRRRRSSPVRLRLQEEKSHERHF